MGFLSQEHGDRVRRCTEFIEARREDEEVGNAAMRDGLVREQAVAAALCEQLNAFNSRWAVPRLLYILERDGKIDPKQAAAIQKAHGANTRSSEASSADGRPRTWRGRQEGIRAHPRFDIEGATVEACASGVFSVSSHLRRWQKAKLVDLSVSGLQMLAPFEIKEGDQLRVAVEVPTRPRPIQGKAVVRWVRGESNNEESIYRGGLEFVGLHPKERTVIEALGREELSGDVPTRLKLAPAG